MVLTAGLIVLAVFLQSVFFIPAGVGPDLVLIVVVYAAFSKGAGKGAFTGFLGGVTEDLFSGGLLGVNALAKVFLGYALGSTGRKFECENKSFQFISVFAVSCASQAFVYAIMQLGGQPVNPALFGKVFFASAFLNAVLAPFIFRLLGGAKQHGRSKSD